MLSQPACDYGDLWRSNWRSQLAALRLCECSNHFPIIRDSNNINNDQTKLQYTPMVSDANITPMASHVNIARLWVLAFDAMILTSPGPEVGSQLRARCWANGYQPQMVRGMPEKLDPPRDFGTNKCSKCTRPLQFEASSDWHIKTESSSPVDIHSPICVSQNLIINRWSSWSNTIICLDLFPYPSPKLRWCKLQDATGHWITWNTWNMPIKSFCSNFPPSAFQTQHLWPHRVHLPQWSMQQDLGTLQVSMGLPANLSNASWQ